MYAQVEKPKENKGRAIANSVGQKKSHVKQGFGFVDNRTEIQMHQHLQRTASRHSSTSNSSSTNQPIQLTITGQNYEYWAKNIKNISGKKLTNINTFLKQVHNLNDIDFSIDEINSFYDAQLSNLNHTQMAEDLDGKMQILKRFSALSRDDEGAHGAEKHGEPGDQFLVDRVNDRRGNGAFTASSLNIDDFLQWDTILKREAGGLYDAYSRLVSNRLDEVRGAAIDGGFTSLQDARDKVQTNMERKEYKPYETESEIVPKIFLSTEFRMGGFREEVNSGKSTFKIPIGAETLGSAELNGRSVSRLAGNPPAAVTFDDVVDIQKRPESYTGGLSPVYTVLPNGSITGKPDKESLDWVTKF